MRVLVITPPEPVVTWEDAQPHLGLEDDDDRQTLVEGMIDAATAHLDGPQGWLGRAIGLQTLEARFDAFGELGCLSGALELPYPPVIDITSVTYLDAAGAPQTLAGSAHEVFGAEVQPVFGTAWPTARWSRDSVRVRYRAGYVADPSASTLQPALPPAIRAAILLMVGDLFANRETTLDARAAGAVAVPMSTTVENLLSPFRVWR